MSIGVTLGGADVAYTVAEVRDLVTAVEVWLDQSDRQEADPVVIMLWVQAHMAAGHKAADIT